MHPGGKPAFEKVRTLTILWDPFTISALGLHHRGFSQSRKSLGLRSSINCTGTGSNLGFKRYSSSENLILGQSGARMVLAGPEVLVILPQPLPCSPPAIPYLGVRGQTPLSTPFLESRALLVWIADFLPYFFPSYAFGAKASTPES